MSFLNSRMSCLKILVTVCVTVQMFITFAILFTGSIPVQLGFNPQREEGSAVEGCGDVAEDDRGFGVEASPFEGSFDRYHSHKTHMFVAKAAAWDSLSQSRKVRLQNFWSNVKHANGLGNNVFVLSVSRVHSFS